LRARNCRWSNVWSSHGDRGGLGELAPGARLAAVLDTLDFDTVPADSSVDVAWL